MTDFPQKITVLPENFTRRYSARYGNYDSCEFYTYAAAAWWLEMMDTIWESKRRRNAA